MTGFSLCMAKGQVGTGAGSNLRDWFAGCANSLE
jgi:hypothetical protein